MQSFYIIRATQPAQPYRKTVLFLESDERQEETDDLAKADIYSDLEDARRAASKWAESFRCAIKVEVVKITEEVASTYNFPAA